MAAMNQPADPQDAAGRRAAIVAQIQAETGIDEAMIARLVDGFYDRVLVDPLIGPVFNDRIQDWEPHLEQMRLAGGVRSFHRTRPPDRREPGTGHRRVQRRAVGQG